MSLFGQPAGGTSTASSIFGGGKPASASGASIFGQPSTNSTTPATNMFGQPAQNTNTTNTGTNMFGQPAQNNSTPTTTFHISNKPSVLNPPSTDGSSSTPAATGTNIFGQPAAAPTSASGSSIFGQSTTAPASASGASIFGQPSTTPSSATGSSIFGQPSTTTPASASGASIFGQPAQTSTTNNASTSLFGQPAQNTTNNSASLFGQPAQNTTNNAASIFGQNTANKSLFGGSTPAPAATPSLFAPAQPSLQQSTNQTTQSQGLTENSTPSLYSQSLNRIWREPAPPSSSIPIVEQISLISKKWHPLSPDSSFSAYLYNQVPPDSVPFYRPDPSESEEKWIEALKSAPSAGSIPVLVKGFAQLGTRLIGQEQHLGVLQGRIHEINNGLAALLQRHDIVIASRAAECQRRHVRLAAKALSLATKTQVLRNRGYALDNAELALREKITALEKQVNDPALRGRGEEIWARMLRLREIGKRLESEMGKGVAVQDEKVDEGVLKKVRKILEDYDSQIVHLRKELDGVGRDWKDFVGSSAV